MTYTHLKVEEDSKAKFKKLAQHHSLTMLRLFGLWVDTEFKKITKADEVVNDLQPKQPLAKSSVPMRPMDEKSKEGGE